MGQGKKLKQNYELTKVNYTRKKKDHQWKIFSFLFDRKNKG